MRNRTQFRETEEATGTLNGVDGTIDAVQAFVIVRILLQRDKILIKLIKILL